VLSSKESTASWNIRYHYIRLPLELWLHQALQTVVTYDHDGIGLSSQKLQNDHHQVVATNGHSGGITGTTFAIIHSGRFTKDSFTESPGCLYHLKTFQCLHFTLLRSLVVLLCDAVIRQSSRSMRCSKSISVLTLFVQTCWGQSSKYYIFSCGIVSRMFKYFLLQLRNQVLLSSSPSSFFFAIPGSHLLW
jgi:hypothetical protein